MRRFKSSKPRTEVLSIKVSKETKRKYKELGLKGDTGIQFLIEKFGNSKKNLEIEKIEKINLIKDLKNEVKQLDAQIVEEEIELQKINEEIGIVEIEGEQYSQDIMSAVQYIISLYESQSWVLEDFFSMNENLLLTQSTLIGIDVEKLKQLITDMVGE